MKRAVIAVALVLTLTACGTPTESNTGHGLLMRESNFTLKDGRTVTCLIYDHASISCDWENAGD